MRMFRWATRGPISLVGLSIGLAGLCSPGVAAPKTTTPKPPAFVTIGTACTSGTGLDATGKRARCLRIKEVGSVWVWSDPVPTPVTDVAVPTSWAMITTDNTGWNDPQASGLTTTYPNRTAIEQSFIVMVNRWRAERNLAPLTHDPRLDRLSKNWAERYTRPEYQGRGTRHCPKNDCKVRTLELGYREFAEVLGDKPMPRSTIEAENYFINSPSHFAILTGHYTHIGVAFHIERLDGIGRPAKAMLVAQLGKAR
jgi:hypothetical protein